MIYYGLHFRLARAATEIAMSDICRELHMSLSTLKKIERSGELQTFGDDIVGKPEKGSLSERRVKALVIYFEERGVEFLATTKSSGPGVRMKV